MKQTRYITANNGRRLKLEIEVHKIYYIIVISDPRFPMWYGSTLMNDGKYGGVADLDNKRRPVRYTSPKDAGKEARRQTRMSRQVGLGRGHGLIHTIMRLDVWEQWQARRAAAAGN